MPKRINIVLRFSVLTVLLGGTAAPAMAQEAISNGSVDFINFLPAALILFFPLGLILLISSAMPEEEAPVTAINLLITWSVAALAYFLVGFAFQFGGIAQVSPRSDLAGLYWEWYPLDQSVEADVARLWGVVALRGWALSGEAATPGALHLFLSHLSLVGVSAMIPAAVCPRRFGRTVILLIGLLSGTVLYPIVGNWLWGGGWLASVGLSLGLGHGLVDFGGASVIFLTGSIVALTALLLFKSTPAEQDEQTEPAEVVVTTGLEHHLTVYDEPEDTAAEILPATPMPAAYLPILSMLGGGLLLLGWFGLATGIQSPTALNFNPAHAAVAGVLAALSAALTAAGYSWFTTSELNPLMTSRGLVAGLIVAMAGAPFLPIWLIVVAGLLMGLLLPLLIYLFNRDLRFADELGTLATYGVSAMVSLLLVPFFADGQAGQGWHGVGFHDYLGVAGQGVSGLVVAPGFVADWPGQLQAQLLGIGAVILWTLIISFLLFQTVKVVADSWARTGLEWADSPARETILSTASAGEESTVAASAEEKLSEAAGENLTLS